MSEHKNSAHPRKTLCKKNVRGVGDFVFIFIMWVCGLIVGGSHLDPLFDEFDLFGGKGTSDRHLSDTSHATKEDLVEDTFVGFVGNDAFFAGFCGAVFVDEGIIGIVCQVESARCACTMATGKGATVFGEDLRLDDRELGFESAGSTCGRCEKGAEQEEATRVAEVALGRSFHACPRRQRPSHTKVGKGKSFAKGSRLKLRGLIHGCCFSSVCGGFLVGFACGVFSGRFGMSTTGEGETTAATFRFFGVTLADGAFAAVFVHNAGECAEV